jgi:hypothetical protein
MQLFGVQLFYRRKISGANVILFLRGFLLEEDRRSPIVLF